MGACRKFRFKYEIGHAYGSSMMEMHSSTLEIGHMGQGVQTKRLVFTVHSRNNVCVDLIRMSSADSSLLVHPISPYHNLHTQCDVSDGHL